ncbi:MAG TPA: hypothetical protein VGE16_14260 [Albitalea sp.]
MKATALRVVTGLALAGGLLLPPLRHALESSMSLHMLVQYPALLLAGALLGAAVPCTMQRRLAAWNVLGISGLAACTLVLAVAMIPRVLDLALVDMRVEAVKVGALLLAGAMLLPSWRAAGLIVQGFFLGNVLPMTAIIGTLYADSPLRLCNAYRLDDQRQLGQALVWIAIAIALAWLARAGRRLMSEPPPSAGAGDEAPPTTRPPRAASARRAT